MDKVCKWCGKKYQLNKSYSQEQKSRSKFCSRDCQSKGRERKPGVPWNKGKRIKPLRKCDACDTRNKRVFLSKEFGKTVCDKHYQHLKLHGRFLSDEECKENLKALRSSWVGKHSWNYKGGRSTLNMVVRRCAKYKKWVRNVFVRDDFTCQKCLARGVRLEADHYPIKYSTILDEEGITTYEQAMSCERLWDESNGRTLCRSCHRGKSIKN